MDKKVLTKIYNFNVTLLGGVDENGMQETVCSYKFKNHSINRFIFVHRNAKETDADCIKKAKWEFNKQYQSGEIEKYSNDYIKELSTTVLTSRNRLASGVVAAFVIAVGLGVGGFFIGKLFSSGGTVKVTFSASPDELHVACFDNNKDTITKTISVAKGTKFGDIKNLVIPTRHEPIKQEGKDVPSIEGKVYDRLKQWNVDETLVSDNFVIDKDLSVYASYERDQATVKILACGNSFGYFKLNDGAAGGTVTRQFSFTVDKGTTLGDALNIGTSESPKYISPLLLGYEEQVGYELKCYFDGKREYYISGEKAKDDLEIKIDEDMVFESIYNKMPSEEEETKQWMNITFNATKPGLVDVTDANLVGYWQLENKTITSTTASFTYEDEDETWTWEQIQQKLIFDNPEGKFGTFNYWKKGDTDEKVEDSTVFDRDVSLYAYYIPDFTNDSWTAFNNNAELGLSRLQELYNDGNSLIGKERKVNVEGYENPINVQIVGEKTDFLNRDFDPSSGDPGDWDAVSSPTAVTFMFTSPAYSCTFGSDKYDYSNVNNYLQGTLYNQIDPELRDAIKPIWKKYFSRYTYYCDQYYLFIFGVDEINGSESTNDLSYNREGGCTDYFKYNNSPVRYTIDTPYNCWCRSTIYNHDDGKIEPIYAYHSGSGPASKMMMDYSQDSSTEYYALPMFAIGQGDLTVVPVAK